MAISLRTNIHDWMFNQSLPFWADNGLDLECGGYVEQFNPGATSAYVDKKRVRVIARQIYVFSHAAVLGFPDGLRCAKHGYEFLTAHGWQGPDRGWARSLTRNGLVSDATPDLYDQAFVLYALAWYYRATLDSAALHLADQTIDTILKTFRAPAGGFLHELPATGHRQQNPHMHLLEAALSLYEVRADERCSSLAYEIINLFQTRFFNAERGTLAEFFTDDLQTVAGEAGRLTEPGHQFEWAWILVKAGGLLNADFGREARSLIKFAEANGVDPLTGVTYQQIRDDGTPIDRGSRTWPNTERLKAAAALYELDGVDPLPIFEQSCSVLFNRHLACTPRGVWTEKFDENGAPCSDAVPTSTFYHVFLAFSEVLRVLNKIERSA